MFNAYISLSPSLVEKISEPLTEQLATFKTPIFYYLAWAENDDNAKVRTIKGLDKLLKGKELASSYYFLIHFQEFLLVLFLPQGFQRL